VVGSAGATAITVFHQPSDPAGFERWLSELTAAAREADGFESAAVSVRNDPQLDTAVAVRFQTEQLLHQWLDSPACRSALERGEGFGLYRRASDLILVAGGQPPAGVAVFLHDVAPSKEESFVKAQVQLTAKTANFSGSEGTVIFTPDLNGEWVSVIRFRTASHLEAWMRSPERQEMLPHLRESLTRNFSEVSVSTPFGSTVRTENGQASITPGWKTFLTVLVVLYPVGMLLKRFLDPELDRADVAPWLGFFVGLAASVALLQWALMPVASAVLRRWLDPVAGRGWRSSLWGTIAVVVACALSFLVFAVVKDLQFWDYMD
jgi:uncharacterized protein